jgi:hypothetical protein
MMMDDRFDELVRGAAREYHTPPETPREVIWARIEAVRRERAARRRVRRAEYLVWARWGVGLAAALAIGIGIGRYAPRGGGGPAATGPAAAVPAEAAGPRVVYRVAATEHLSRAEIFLTSFRAEAQGRSDASFWSGAGELLVGTRLLLDSPAAEDPVLRSLLEDLELVLVQVVRLAEDRGGVELELVSEGLERGGLLERLRTVIPAGPATGVEGAV